MELQDPPVLVPEPELHLLREWRDEDLGRRTRWAAAGSALAHVFFVLGAFAIATYMPPPKPFPESQRRLDISKSVPLVAPPPRDLTQKETNTAKVAKQLTLENLTAKPEVKPTPKVFSSPPVQRGRPAPAPPPVLEPGQVNIAQAPPPALGNTIPSLPQPAPAKPPQIQTEEKPKLAFERPGANMGTAAGTGRIEVPKAASVEERVRGMSQSSGSGGAAVGDVGVDLDTGIGQSLPQPGSTGRQASSLQLLSDPMGVDFKPYLVRVLTAVRRNWFAVIPESARFGRRGKVVIQFSIARAGAVPKLVIDSSSGTDALDRAAVAGISASVPFPPLPAEFKGEQIRVQLAFFYNVPNR